LVKIIIKQTALPFLSPFEDFNGGDACSASRTDPKAFEASRCKETATGGIRNLPEGLNME